MKNSLRTRRLVAVGLLLIGVIAGCWGGITLTTASRASAAEIRRGPPREAFKSGGERAVEVLEKMAASLDRIEKRLESIEKAIVDLKTQERN